MSYVLNVSHVYFSVFNIETDSKVIFVGEKIDSEILLKVLQLVNDGYRV